MPFCVQPYSYSIYPCSQTIYAASHQKNRLLTRFPQRSDHLHHPRRTKIVVTFVAREYEILTEI